MRSIDFFPQLTRSRSSTTSCRPPILVTLGRGPLRWREGPGAASRRGARRDHGPGLSSARLIFGMRSRIGDVRLDVALRCSSGAVRRRGGPSCCAWPPTCPRGWWRSTTAHRIGFSRRGPDHGCSGRTARAQTRITGRASSCCASSALTVSVGAGQVTLSTLRERARMFCYWTFTHPCSVTRDRSGSRSSSTVLAHACHGTCGRV